MFKATAVRLREILPRSFRQQLVRVGRFFTPKITPDTPLREVTFPSLEGAFISLKMRGFKPRLILDIGAYQGDWAILAHEYFPESSLIMFEAQEDKRNTLENLCKKAGGWLECRMALLGSETGRTVKFAEMETGSSVYEENSPYHRKVITRTITSLDDLLQDDTRVVDFIKLDVQGYELEVLRGAKTRLKQAQVVLMESSLIPINLGAPLIDDVVEFMRNHDYRLVDFCSQIRRLDGALWQTDLLFIRKNSPYLPSEQLSKENW